MNNYRQYGGMRTNGVYMNEHIRNSNMNINTNCACESAGEPQTVSVEVSKACRGDMAGFPIAMTYVPKQAFRGLFDAHNALEAGTLFRELKLDFIGGGCCHGRM